MAKIFISYRREDSGFAVDQLHGALKPYVDNPSADIFIDVDNIPPGVDFVDHLDKKVAQCEVMLVAIGQRWLDAVDPPIRARGGSIIRMTLCVLKSRGHWRGISRLCLC